MKLSTTSLVLSLGIFAGSVSGYQIPSLVKRSPVAKPNAIVQSRQANLKRVALVQDNCATINSKTLTVGSDGVFHSVGVVNQCMCVQYGDHSINAFVYNDPVGIAAVNAAGIYIAESALEGLIFNAPDSATCTYPANAIPGGCQPGAPCSFQCSNGYVPYVPLGSSSPTTCYCPSPSIACNGQCGSFPNGCGSAVPVLLQKKRRNVRERRSLNGERWDVEGLCEFGKSVCGVGLDFNGSKRGWECIDTARDKESCGGCVFPAPFSNAEATSGVDCTAIPNVDKVGCVASSCYIRSCADGFVPSNTHDKCVKDEGATSSTVLSMGEKILLDVVGGGML
ncbi:hypothetical protein C8Q75DRAFT_608169 [Abortiporus biennis]|nr:hypothetical protein C8Q75DRAFT_608169 [Abortiporus biennis]